MFAKHFSIKVTGLQPKGCTPSENNVFDKNI